MNKLKAVTRAFAFAGVCIALASADENANRYNFARAEPSAQQASEIAATFTVKPGQSIQAAIDRAQAGDRVELLPGVYEQTVAVDRDGISIVGKIENGERPVLDGKNTMGDAVQVSGSDFSIEGIAIRNYLGNGVVANKAKNVRFVDLVVDNTGLYGVYPVECVGVHVERCVVSRIADAGIYVGQSKDIVVQDNEVYNNVAGIEIENSSNALVSNNSAHHNTGGILVFVLPNNPSKIGENTRVVGNRLWANNHPNFAKPGSSVSFIPPGIGVFVMAADRTEITKNIFEDNQSFGISVVSLKNSSSLKGKEYTLDVQPDSDHTLIHGNTFVNNGSQPAPRYIELAGKGGDLFWDGTGQGNAWNESPDLVTVPPALPKPDSAFTGAGR